MSFISPTEKEVEDIANGMIALGVFTFVLLHFENAPFGKHAPDQFSKYGPLLNARICWFVMECPNVVNVLRRRDCYQTGTWKNLILLTLFCLHYINRSIIYPYRMSSHSRPMPLANMLCAFFFCSLNGFLQVESLCLPETKSQSGLQFYSGIAIFIGGMYINYQSDEALRNLKMQHKKYCIPKGMLFEYVSCPNFLGEIIEWFGFAIASGSRASFAFAFYTVCNLIPRANAHHNWYRSTFSDYPLYRNALFPPISLRL